MKDYKKNHLKFVKDLLTSVKKSKKQEFLAGNWHLKEEKDPISEFVYRKYSSLWKLYNDFSYMDRITVLTGVSKNYLIYLAQLIDNHSTSDDDLMNERIEREILIDVLEEEIENLKWENKTK